MSAQEELLQLSKQLLDSIDQQDWQTYTNLCDENLTAFEPEAVGSLVEGMPFHQFYFEMEGTGRAKQSTISSPKVQLLDESTAIVTYIRLTQRIGEDGRPSTSAFEETRIWHRQADKWQHVHFHRSNAGSIRLG
ncbi:MAG: DUF4440 domain-containing protein [Planctomycetaceae bacterium]|nr:DUF4440 domain-containing protein [Planctomycetaceae bacterium]